MKSVAKQPPSQGHIRAPAGDGGGGDVKVKMVTEELCGYEFSASTISRFNEKLDKELEEFAQRPLEED